MDTLIIKIGATGDVVRTTPLLRRLQGTITWLTAAKNRALLDGLTGNLRCYSWEERNAARDRTYDLVISLEDDRENGAFIQTLEFKQLFGAYLDRRTDKMGYTADASQWFDLSLISSHGREEADRRKLLNRRTYQDFIFEGLKLGFYGEEYVLPPSYTMGLRGDVAISAIAGPVWPMKAWAYYQELQSELESRGFSVNVLPTRSTLLEHLADVRGHRCLVSGDSLPMHLALGSGVRCVSLFTCTSPWEIYDYNRQIKLVSPMLEQFFYQRGFDRRATTAIRRDEVLTATLKQLQ